jgi:serine/threonine protein kinase
VRAVWGLCTALGTCKLERDVAVKVLKTRSGGVSERRRLRKEALALSRLNHPNIEGIYSIESDGDIDFLVFELLSGCTLADRIQGPLDQSSIVTFGVQIAGAVPRLTKTASFTGISSRRTSFSQGNAGSRCSILDWREWP